jgi:RNA-splicing ligase RtcB
VRRLVPEPGWWGGWRINLIRDRMSPITGEASGAYKDIDVLMEEQKDMVEILVTLEPLAVVKG